MSSVKGDTKTPRGRSRRDSDTQDKAVGDALRRVYHQAIDESIPDEMLDLLNKLG